MTDKILIVEDELALAHVLSNYLEGAGFECAILSNGLDVEPWIKKNQPKMILLDIELPGQDGFSLCESIRRYSIVPIVMITGKVDESDRLRGLNTGADDYICKPFHPREVVARVKAIFRRLTSPHERLNNLEVTPEDDIKSNFTLDAKRFRLSMGAKNVSLTGVQCKLLSLFMGSEGQTLSRESLKKAVYSTDKVVSDRTIDSHIRELRKQIAVVLHTSEVIFSIYGEGYKFEPPAL